MMYGNNEWLDRLNEMINEHLKKSPANKQQQDSSVDKDNHLDPDCKNLSKDQYKLLLKTKRYMELGKYQRVEEASLAAGYHDVGDFTSQFEEVFGETPQVIIDDIN
jgi:methylphosphotriester-DNA--protein-cysteine methyltransferase